MEQEITYSSSLISFLASDASFFDDSDQKKVWSLIKQNKIAVDLQKRILECYGEEVGKLDPSIIKQELQNFVDGLINNKGNKIKTYNIKPFTDNQEINIVLSSHDKIYFSPLFSNSECRKLVIKHDEIEAHSTKTFINPEPFHRLKNVPTEIIFEKNVQYDFQKILDPFLRNAKKIKIIDPYLPNPTALSNLKKILKPINPTEIVIVVFSKNIYLSKKPAMEINFISFENYLKELKRQEIKVNVYYFNSKNHKERFIVTDELKIKLPGGFDCLDENGYSNIENESDEKSIDVKFRLRKQ